MKEICGKCKNFASGKIATWLYMPMTDSIESPFYCDDCVPRGCSCQIDMDNECELTNIREQTTEEIVSYKDVRDNPRHRRDEQDRLLPCIEFEYDEFGFDVGTSGGDVIEKMFKEAKSQGRVLYEKESEEDEDI